MFQNCCGLTNLDVSHFNTSNVTDMMQMFYYCGSLTSLDVSHFDTSNVTNMHGMFGGCKSLTSLDVSNFNTSNVTDMSDLFSVCSSLTSLDLSNFNTSNVTTMEWMFSSCSSLTSLDVSNFNTSNVTEMGYMFEGCSSIKNIDLSNFNTSKVTSMGYMFDECSSLRTINVGDKWSTSNVTEGDNMFAGCGNLIGSKGTAYSSSYTGYDYAQIDGGENDPGYLSNPGYVWKDMYARLSGSTMTFYYDENMTDGDHYPGYSYDAATRESITHVIFDSSFADARPTSTSEWFFRFENLQSIEGVANLITSNVTSMANMFNSCSSLTSLDVSHFNTSNVKDMQGMFNYCSSVTSFDVSHFDTSNVTDMRGMFKGCSSLTSLDVSHFNTSNVTDMGGMFELCKSLTTLDVSNFNTSNVTDMCAMFHACKSLEKLNLNGFNTSNVTNMRFMFEQCESLTTLNIINFDFNSVTDISSLFEMDYELETIYCTADLSGIEGTRVFWSCTKLQGCKGTTHSQNFDKEYARPDKEDQPGYFSDDPSYIRKHMYVRLTGSGSDKTMTFYYDGNKTKTDYNLDVSAWENDADNITHVFFDGSFADAKPSTTASWFYGFENLESIEDIANLNTSNVTNMAGMFMYCASLNNLDVSHFNTSNVTNMGGMFMYCASLTSLDVRNFDTSNVTDMSNMFGACASLTSLDVSNFNTSNVTNMKYMFSNCQSLTKLNLLNLDFSSVTDISWMFGENYKLETIYCTADLSGVESGVQAFIHCKMLEGGNGTSYSNQKMFQQYARPDREGQPGYFTEDINHVRKYKYARLTGGGSNKTLTFYYDLNKTDDDYIVADDELHQDKRWSDEAKNITHVIFDGSFAEAKPSTTALWFADCENLQAIDGITNLNTCGVTNMYCMFDGCSSLASLDVSHFNTSNVTYLESMFNNCSSLTSLDVSHFDTSNLTSMRAMFNNCSSLTSLDVSNFNTSNVTAMSSMFSNCSSLTSLDLSNFDTSNVTAMSSMFSNCSSLRTINVGDKWSTSNVTEGDNMFYGCKRLIGCEGTAYSSSHTGYDYAQIDGGENDPGYFSNPGYVRKDMYARLSGSTLTFYYDENMTGGDYLVNDRGWSESASTITNVVFDNSFTEARPTSTASWFDGFENLQSIEGIANLNTSNVTDMNCMFRGCTALASLNVSNFDTGNVTNMVAMFQNLSSLASLDVSHFDTSNVTDMAWMFDGCSALTSLDLSNFNTSKVTDMGIMFHGCIALASVIVSNFDTGNVTTMEAMFQDCSSLISLDLRHFDTSNVTTMAWMFDGCSSLGTILVSDKWSIANVTEAYNMFYGCENLVGCRGTTYSSSHIEYDYAHIDEGESNPGYLSIELILLTAEDVTFGSGDMTYNGSAQMPEVTVTHGGSALTVGTDYSLTVQQKQANDSYADVENAINIGSYKLIVTGIGAYLGTFSKDFTISAKALTDDMVTLSAESFDFNGEAQKPTVTVKDGENTLEEGIDYDLTNEGGINPGTYSAKVDGKGNYCGEVTKTYVIVAETVEEGDVKGAVIDEENKEVILTDIDVEPGTTAVTIPTTIGDYTVVAIAANTLAGMTDVTDINLPETEEPLGLGTNALRIDDTHVATVHTPLALLDDYALNTQLQQNFEAGKVTAVVTAPNKYWTFSCGVDVLLPDGVGVYTCQLNSTKTAIEITQIDDLQLMVDGKKVIKANNGVLVACIDGTGGNAYDIVANPGGQESGTVPATTDAKSYGLDNQLEPVIKSANYAAGNYYVLVGNEFHPIIDNSSEVPACKAVLKLPTMVAASRGLIIVGNNDGTTGISGVSMEAVNSDWFDLNGHRIERPTTKGVFINNGKIVIIK